MAISSRAVLVYSMDFFEMSDLMESRATELGTLYRPQTSGFLINRLLLVQHKWTQLKCFEN